jgi:membrane associated rhomboid family serine protease
MLEDREYMRRPDSGGRLVISATLWLIIINVAVFVCSEVLRVSKPELFGRSLEFLALSKAGLLKGFVWQLFTFQFLHAGLGHLAFNMLGLFFFGRPLEDYIGKKRFLILYFAAGTMGGLLQALLGFALPSLLGGLVVGASAGVFGVVAAVSRLMPDLELLVFFVFPMKARVLLWIELALAVICIFIPMQTGVAHAAHLGGILTGVIWIAKGWHLEYTIMPWEGLLQRYWHSRGSRQRRRELVRAGTARPGGRPPDVTPEAELPPEEFISQAVDPILDKISAHGIQSLTERERKTLEQARKKITKR